LAEIDFHSIYIVTRCVSIVFVLVDVKTGRIAVIDVVILRIV